MNRAELQLLAEDRALDAEALVQAGRWSGAYYLAGYAAECGLKACIAKLTQEFDYPSKEFVLKCYTHKLDELVKLAELVVQREQLAKSNLAFSVSWDKAKDWDEKSRYVQWSEQDARLLVEAIGHPINGVLAWIKVHW